ncbi:MAG: hypothetical protein HY300_01865, partial [Verrucomicrobia bacterium]|nr:hypothetical protein [Verrucomicrobiota bacterium]
CRAALKHKSARLVDQASKRLEDEQNQVSPVDAVRFLFSRMIMPFVGRAMFKAMRTQTQRELTVAAIALKRHQLRHGRFPASLDALVPDFLPALPVDFMDGQPLRYRLNADGSFLLYSVGDDFKDDGGNGEMMPDKKLSVYLWNCRDAVWPAPASAEELEAFQSKQRKKK